MGEFELVWDAKCELGESPVWDAHAHRLLFTDIPAGHIHRYAVADGERARWDFGEPVASFGLCRSGQLVVALQRHVVLFDPHTGVITRLTEPIPEPETNRLNDGKVGPDGCFWIGTQNQGPDGAPTACLYRVTPDGKMERKQDGYVETNGLAWTPDGRTMFHAESRELRIDAWDFDPATGRISNRRTIASLDKENDGTPDGGACDEEGCYWSAGNGAGCINRFTPDGRLMARFPFPVPAPTMPCFAGRELYVTSMRQKRSKAELARHPALGGVFRMAAAVAGAPVGVFADT
jgi:sugar lactone lactonase YvrE